MISLLLADARIFGLLLTHILYVIMIPLADHPSVLLPRFPAEAIYLLLELELQFVQIRRRNGGIATHRTWPSPRPRGFSKKEFRPEPLQSQLVGSHLSKVFQIAV